MEYCIDCYYCNGNCPSQVDKNGNPLIAHVCKEYYDYAIDKFGIDPATLTSEHTYLTDAGHGWLSVTLRELKILGIENDISDYSYQSGGEVYLEHDFDAPLFENAMLEKLNQKLNIVHEDCGQYCVVRGYYRYGKNPIVQA